MPCDEVNRIDAEQSQRNNVQVGKRAKHGAGSQSGPTMARRRNQRRHSTSKSNLCQRIHLPTLSKW